MNMNDSIIFLVGVAVGWAAFFFCKYLKALKEKQEKNTQKFITRDRYKRYKSTEL